MEKTVLCVYKERKRPVTFMGSTDPVKDRKNLYEATIASFSDVLEGSSSSDQTSQYFLQKDSVEWGGLIDLAGFVEDRSTVHLCFAATSNAEISSTTKKAKEICKNLGKPSEASAKALGSLFPGCAKKLKFDPSEQCVAKGQQRRKKSTTKGRSKTLTVVVMNDIPACIPKGAMRERLRKIGRIKDIAFQRYLDEDEVRELLTESFSDLEGVNLQYLQPNRKNNLTVAKEQNLNGIEVIELAKSGSLYLKSNFKEVPQKSTAGILQSATKLVDKLNLPQAPGSSAMCPLSLSDEETKDLIVESTVESDVSECATPVPTTESSENLEEWRALRREQDEEFDQSLQIDRAKEAKKRKREEWHERVDELQTLMKTKFSTTTDDPTSGVKVGFKLPCGNKLEHHFSQTCTVKSMYQFILGSGLLPPFVLCITHPRKTLSLQTCGDDSIQQYHDILVHVNQEEENQYDLLSLQDFLDPIFPNDAFEVTEDDSEERVTYEDESDRELYMQSIGAVVGIIREVQRDNIFEDVIKLYKEGEIVGEYPIFVKYEDEKGVDDGGIRRDMFTAFWEKAYSLLFEGATTLVPMVHPQMDLSLYPILGRVISHGYLATGILPDRIALPTLLTILFGSDVQISSTMIMDAFLDYISSYERQILKKALAISSSESCFPQIIVSELTSVLSRFGCRKIPKPSTLICEIERVARYEFCTKPAAGIVLMNSGLAFREYWMKKTPTDVYLLHCRMTASVSKVISLLDLEILNESERRVSEYLTTMIGNMSTQELRFFLRFVTGASVCISSKILVTFNSLSGFGRRPIAHTCNCLLDLSVSYANYDDFAAEIEEILSSTENEFSWRMDAI